MDGGLRRISVSSEAPHIRDAAIVRVGRTSGLTNLRLRSPQYAGVVPRVGRKSVGIWPTPSTSTTEPHVPDVPDRIRKAWRAS